MTDNIFDLYVVYLLSSFGSVTTTGLSEPVDGLISHDKITRLMSFDPKTSADLRSIVKPLIRQIESYDGVLIINDSISEKPSTDENDIINILKKSRENQSFDCKKSENHVQIFRKCFRGNNSWEGIYKDCV